MGHATTPVLAPSATPAVRALVADLEAQSASLADEIVERIRETLPDFRRVPRSTLRRAVDGNLARALAALRELRPSTPAELEASAAVGRERAEQGLTLDSVLAGHRVTVGALWGRFGELARERGVDVASVLAFSQTLWHWADAIMDVVAAAHRAVELQLVREEQQQRDALVLAALHGTVEASELGRASAAHGLDPEQAYMPFRAAVVDGVGGEGLIHRLAMTLGHDEALFTGLDGDVVGLATQAPRAVDGVAIGLGPAARLAALPRSFMLASRAQQTALAFGQSGVFSMSDLSIRPAILVDEDLGDAFVAHYLEPLETLGRVGADIEATLRAWLEHGMRIEETARALHVHPNTLRHRLRRFEELTDASLRRPHDLVELWWALERRRLRSTGAG